MLLGGWCHRMKQNVHQYWHWPSSKMKTIEISKGLSEAVIQRKIDITMVKRWRAKRQTMVNNTENKRLNNTNPVTTSRNSSYSGRVGCSCSTRDNRQVTHVKNSLQEIILYYFAMLIYYPMVCSFGGLFIVW